jgi:uncharacterized integral membrane protein
MVIIGFLLIVAATAAATVLITQNTGRVEFHALGHAWNGGEYWLIVAGLITLAAAVVGALAVNRSLSRRLGRDRIALIEENDDDLADRLGLIADEPASIEEHVRGSQRARHGLFRRHRAAM